MKTKILAVTVLIAASIVASSCKKDSYPIPTASTVADFSYEVAIVQVGTDSKFQVTFTNKSIQAQSYLWDFGNGTTSTEKDPVETFDPGQYTVKLTVTTANGDLYYNKLSKSMDLNLVAKEFIYMENFDSGIPSTYTLLDADGDGHNWYWDSYAGDGYILSASYDDVDGALHPDNWIFTPEIDLTGEDGSKDLYISYTVCPTASTPAYRTETYAVYVSTVNSTNPSDYLSNVITNETLTEDMTNWVYVPREFKITQFAGQKIRIAFRHYASTDLDRISINDVGVYRKLF